jgi:hypothetical protein
VVARTAEVPAVGTADSVDTRESTSAGRFTLGWQHGTVAELMEDEATPDLAGGARSMARCLRWLGGRHCGSLGSLGSQWRPQCNISGARGVAARRR